MEKQTTLRNRRSVTHHHDGDRSSCKTQEIYAVSQFSNSFWKEIAANVSCFYTSCCIFMSKRFGPMAVSPTMLKVYMAASEDRIKAQGYNKDYLTQLMKKFPYVKGRTGRFFKVHEVLLKQMGLDVKFAFLSTDDLFTIFSNGEPFIVSIPTTSGGHVVVAWIEEGTLRVLDPYGEFDITKMSYVSDAKKRAAEYTLYKGELDEILLGKSRSGVNILYE